MSNDVIIFAEDPGAANYILPLPSALQKQKITSRLFVLDPALTYLKNKGVEPELFPYEIPAKNLLDNLQPKILMVGTSENPATKAFELILSARGKGIVTIGYIDSFANADFRFRGYTGNSLAYAPDFLIVPDAETKHSFINLGYSKKNLFLCGHPFYDQIVEQREIFQANGQAYYRRKLFPTFFDLTRQIIIFIAELSTGLNPEQYQYSGDYTLKGWGSTKRTDIVIEEFLSAIESLQLNPYLVLRLHPKNTLKEFEKYRKYFHVISQEQSVLDVVYAGDLIVGMTSSVLQESLLLGKKTLSILPRAAEKKWVAPDITVALNSSEIRLKILQKINDEDILPNIPKATSLSSIVAVINSKLKNLSKVS